MRIGTTSYVYPADILTNVKRLAGNTQDIELIVFEADPNGSDLLSVDELFELQAISAVHDLSYTIHLPLDLELAGPQPDIERTCLVMAKFSQVNPLGYTLHLDTRFQDFSRSERLKASHTSLSALHERLESWDKICVENLEDQDPEMMDIILESFPLSACIDIGHLWKQGLDAAEHLERWIERTEIIHLHGLHEKDHKSLGLMSPDLLDPVVEIINNRFQGVLTFEIFSEKDWFGSVDAFKASLERVKGQ